MKLLTGLLGLSAANANQCCDYIKVNGNGNLHKMNAIFKRRTDQNSETGTPKYERVNEYGEQDHTMAWVSREQIDNFNKNGAWSPALTGKYWIMGDHSGVSEWSFFAMLEDGSLLVSL